MSKSFFFYIHKDLSGENDVWKIGVSITPYSAVRSRQKFMWRKFHLDHLYFGRPRHIEILEDTVKSNLFNFSATHLLCESTQTELFKIPIDDLINHIDAVIKNKGLHIAKMQLTTPYSASKSGDCPFGIPPEDKSFEYLMPKVKQTYGEDPQEALVKKLFDWV